MKTDNVEFFDNFSTAIFLFMSVLSSVFKKSMASVLVNHPFHAQSKVPKTKNNIKFQSLDAYFEH